GAGANILRAIAGAGILFFGKKAVCVPGPFQSGSGEKLIIHVEGGFFQQFSALRLSVGQFFLHTMPSIVFVTGFLVNVAFGLRAQTCSHLMKCLINGIQDQFIE
ncbi:hypothetical protein ACJX0J_026404, partial [Zea mays]